ncbi:MG2 domain-containing protein [Photobacterium japonica]|uniref:alpha-2-macroglobulin family protein n=1 Tax=Photobacterium japonica TaxID=2910235 RepID=UPI003D0BB648
MPTLSTTVRWFYTALWLFLLTLYSSVSTATPSVTQPDTQAATTVLQTPEVAFVGTGPLVPRSHSQSIPITAMNLSEVDVEILQITDPDTFLNQQYLLDSPSPYTLEQLKHAYKSVFSDRFTLPAGAVNTHITARLPIPHTFDSGWYVVVLKAPGSFYEIQAKHMLLTNVGIQARLYDKQAVFSMAWLSDGAAIREGVVELYRDHKRHQTVNIDDQGLAVFDMAVKPTDVVVVRANAHGKQPADIGILPLREVPLDLSDHAVGGRSYQAMEALIYSNRDLVKPGETLPVNVLLRDQDGKAITDMPVTLHVLNPLNEVILSRQLKPQAAGYFFSELETAASWMTGRYKVDVRLDPSAKKPISRFFFELEEFVPERMDLTFTAPSPLVTAGKDVLMTMKGRYLFGSPAAGNVLTTDLIHQPVQHLPGPFEAFYVGHPQQLDNVYETRDRQTLSEQGEVTVLLPTPEKAALKSPVATTANFALLEAGGAAVQRSLRYITWQDAAVPGIRPASDNVGYDSNAEFALGLISADGQALLAGELTVTMDYDQGAYYWLYEEGIGWSRKKQDRWRRVATQTVNVADGKTDVQSFPVSWGDYRITVTDTATEMSSSYTFYAGWYAGSEQIKAKPEHADIKLDKESYVAGESIKATITAPIAGSMLVTLETDQREWSTRVKVKKGKHIVRVPIAKDLARHDIYLTATLTGQQANTPKRYFGIVPVTLDRDDRRLTAHAALPEVIRPLESLSIPITVNHIAPEQADNTWVTVSIVDKGIINLSRFMPQDPFDYFFAQRRYRADVVDLYSRLYDLRPNPYAQSRFGSDAMSKTDNKNDDVVESKTVILMSAPMQVVDGRADVTFDMPDYNGEGQVIVTVYNGTQVGIAVDDATIAAPVVAELSVPRFVVPGDAASVTVDLHNVSGETQTLALRVGSSEGVTLDPKDATDAATPTVPASVTLEDGQHVSYRVPFSLSKTTDARSVLFALQASNDTLDIARDWTVPVKHVTPWVNKGSRHWIKPEQSLAITAAQWQGLQTVAGEEGHALISRTPLLNVADQARALYGYPYGCAEQTTSKALPYLYTHPALTTFKAQAYQNSHVGRSIAKGSTPPSDQAVLYQAVMALKAMQTPMGGFALWRSEGQEQLWLTAYVTDFLLQVEKAHAGTVPEAMRTRALSRLEEYLNYPGYTQSMSHNVEAANSALAYAAYVLAAEGKVRWSQLEALPIETYPSMLSYLHMAASYAQVGDHSKALTMLKQAKTIQRQRNYMDDYGSVLRDNAKAVSVLDTLTVMPVLNDAATRLQATFLESVIDQQASESWLSTQERGALLQAAIVTEARNKAEPISVNIASKALTEIRSVEVAVLPGITLSNPNDFPLYVNLQATGYAKANKAVSNRQNPDNTLKVNFLKRSLYQLDGQAFAGNTVKVGDRLLVILQVNLNEGVPDGLMVERIPAGFVLENPRLTAGFDMQTLMPEGFSLDTPDHVEYRNDRFVLSQRFSEGAKYTFAYLIRAEVPGQYTVPPMFMESMYTPEKHAVYWQAKGDDMIVVTP